MTIATIVCLTAQFCVNPVNITVVKVLNNQETCIYLTNSRSCEDIALPIADILRQLDNGPVAVTFAAEPKS